MNCIKYILLSVSLLFLFSTVHAASIKGIVTEKETGLPLVEACVTLKGNGRHFKALTNLDGSYSIRHIPDGSYTITARSTGLQESVPIALTIAGDSIHTIDFALNPPVLIHATIKNKAIDPESDRNARKSEQTADNVINIVSARAMQISPDITVANVLQRVSGVSVERSSNGDGRYAIVRGMDQRYNYTLVNGIKIPSPDDKYRYVPMDIFPSELLERLEVVKSLTPAMEGDAIGGVVNLVMKNAPDSMYFSANSGTGYSQLYFDRSYADFDHKVINKQSPAEEYGASYKATQNDFPRENIDFKNVRPPLNCVLGTSWGNRFLKKRNLGIMIGASYQNTYRGSNSVYLLPSVQPLPENVPGFSDILIRKYSTQQIRSGIHSKIDYVISPAHKISLYTVYVQMIELQSRYTIDTALSVSRTGQGFGTVDQLYRSRYQKQSVYNNTLQGTHRLSEKLSFNWSGVYSIAKNQIPDWAEFITQHSVTPDPDNNQVIGTTVLLPYYRRWQRNSDQDLAFYLNLAYKFKWREFETEVSAGGLYRDKHRDNYYIEYKLSPVLVNGSAQTYTNVYDANYEFTGNGGQGSQINPNTYTANEKILAYYAQAKINYKKKLLVIGGVRIENTSQSYETVMPPTYPGKSGKISYQDLLPSVNFKYSLTKKQNLRLSYFKSISRPGFFEIIPYNIQGEYFTETGNPYLKHTVAQNLDLRYEFFPKGIDQLLVGVFYKNIQNPIEKAYVRTGTSGQFLQPNNFGTANNIGFEFVLVKYFGKIGISSNYTYTSSKITTDKTVYYRDASGSLTNKTVQQTRSLQGQSPHVANFSLLYKNSDKGLDIQLAFVYTGKRITQVSPYYGLDYWQRGVYQLDFSIEKRVFKKFSIYAKLGNILNSPVVVEIIQPNVYRTGQYALPYQTRDDRILVQRDYYYQTYLVGIRYKL